MDINDVISFVDARFGTALSFENNYIEGINNESISVQKYKIYKGNIKISYFVLLFAKVFHYLSRLIAIIIM